MTSKNKPDGRLAYLDYLRVLATVCVIVLHAVYIYFNESDNFARPLWYMIGYVNEACRAGVPLFFMISGYLMLSREITDIKAFYKKRFLKIAIPFLIYDLFYFFMGTGNGEGGFSLKGFLSGILYNGNEYHLWFVYSILFLYLLTPFLGKMVRACSERWLWILLILATFQTTLRPFVNYLVPGSEFNVLFTSDGFSGYVGYFILGYVLGTYAESRVLRRVIYAVGTLSFAVVPLVAMNSMISGTEVFFNGGYTINHYAEASAVFLFFKNANLRRTHFISELSSVSFNAYLIHVFIVETLREAPIYVSPWKQMAIYITVTAVGSFVWGLVLKYGFILVKKLLSLLNPPPGSVTPDKRLR